MNQSIPAQLTTLLSALSMVPIVFLLPRALISRRRKAGAPFVLYGAATWVVVIVLAIGIMLLDSTLLRRIDSIFREGVAHNGLMVVSACVLFLVVALAHIAGGIFAIRMYLRTKPKKLSLRQRVKVTFWQAVKDFWNDMKVMWRESRATRGKTNEQA
jgi:hypothetical protein